MFEDESNCLHSGSSPLYIHHSRHYFPEVRNVFSAFIRSHCSPEKFDSLDELLFFGWFVSVSDELQ